MFAGSLISLDDLASHPDLQHLGLKRNTVRNWLRRGVGGLRLKGYKVGRRWHVQKEDLFDFFQKLADRRTAGSSSRLQTRAEGVSAKLRSALRERGLI
jgi:Helix-turn-helix domain